MNAWRLSTVIVFLAQQVLLFLLVVVPQLASLSATAAEASTTNTQSTQTQTQSPHTENYAVIVSSSQYWFNYRHTINALTMYKILKDQGGFTDDRIILMLADEYAINPRNPFKNFLTSTSSAVAENKGKTASSSSSLLLSSLYDGDEIEIDYRGHDVTVENLARVLSGRAAPSMSGPVLPPDTPQANIFVYLTGHGGDSFFKFQDVEEILAADLAAILAQRSFHKLLFMADTCQAFTLGDQMEDMENVIMIGSSLRDESSYAHHSNSDLGLSMIERYTYAVQQYFQRLLSASTNKSKQIKNNNNNDDDDDDNVLDTTPLHKALVAPYSYESQRAHIGIRPASMSNDTSIMVADFFVNRQGRRQNGNTNDDKDHYYLAPPARLWQSKKMFISRQQQQQQQQSSTDEANEKRQSSLLPRPRQNRHNNNDIVKSWTGRPEKVAADSWTAKSTTSHHESSFALVWIVTGALSLVSVMLQAHSSTKST